MTPKSDTKILIFFILRRYFYDIFQFFRQTATIFSYRISVFPATGEPIDCSMVYAKFCSVNDSFRRIIVWQKQDAGNNGYAWLYGGNSLFLYENRTIIAKFINPFTDVGFKIIFGQEMTKGLLIDFLNDLLVGERHIQDRCVLYEFPSG